MPKQLHLSCIIDLSDDVFGAAETISSVRQGWNGLLDALQESKIKHVHTCETLETRAKVERKPRMAKGAKVPVVPALELGK